MAKYLDETGLGRVWSNIKTYLTNNYQPKGSYASSDHTHSNYVDGSAGTTAIKKIWCGSQSSYNAISSKSADTLYFIV